MLPVVHGPDVTRRRILLYALVVAPTGLAPWALGFAGTAYGIAAAIGGVAFVGFALAVHVRREGLPARRAAGRMFGFSILWLAALFATLAAERLFS